MARARGPSRVYGVPWDQRHAAADTSARATVTGSSLGRATTAWEHRLRAVNGTLVTDAVG